MATSVTESLCCTFQARSVVVDMEEGVVNEMLRVSREDEDRLQ